MKALFQHKAILIICILILSLHALPAGQNRWYNIDSLKQCLNNASEKEKPEILLSLGFEYSYMDSFELGLNYLNHALEQSKKNELPNIEAAIYYQLGDLYFHFDDYTKAQENFVKAYQLAEKTNDYELLIYSSAGLGGVYTEISDWNSAKKYVNIAIKLAKEKGFHQDIPKILNLLGIIFSESNQLDSAIYYFENILKAGEQQKDSFLMGCAYNNLANARIKQGKYEEAIGLLNHSYNINSVKKKTKAVASIFSNLGKSHMQLKHYDKALKYLILGLKIANKQDYLNIKIEIYKTLSSLYEEKGEHKLSLDYYRHYTACSDSLFNIEKQKQINNLKLTNQQAQAERKMDLLRQQKMTRNIIIYFSIFAIFLLLVLIFQVYRSFKLKIKLQETEKIKMTTTIEQLNRELTSLAMNLEQKKHLLNQVEESIKNIKSTSDQEPIKDFLNTINSKFKADNYLEHNWDAFLKHFDSVHPDFIKGLQDKHPDLNANDIKQCAYIKLNMGLKEIAIMNNINVKSVHMIRYRLKRKLGLDSETDLTHYINSL